MEKSMENEMETLGPFKGYIGKQPTTGENQMEKNMEHDMETGYMVYGFSGFQRRW